MPHVLLATLSVALTIFPPLASTQSQRSNFSGHWTLREGVGSRGASILAGRDITISQTASAITITRSQDSVTLALLLDGREHTLSLPAYIRRDPPVEVAYKAEWEGGALAIATTRTVKNVRFGTLARLYKKETLSMEDGSFLVVRTETADVSAPDGPVTVKEQSIYQRKK